MLQKNSILYQFKSFFQGIWINRQLLASFVRIDLQKKYNRSIFGVAWSIITPLGLSIIIGSIYSIIYGVNPADFIPVLFSGLNPWLFISGAMDGGTMAYISAEGYLKQTNVSPQIFPLRVVLVSFVNYIFSMLTFFAIYLFLKPNVFSYHMVGFLFGTITLFFATWGLVNYAAVITLFLRDFQPLQSLLLQALFYVTPIIFTTSMLDEKGFSIAYKINPFYYLLFFVRQPAQGGGTSSYLDYLIAFFIAFLIFVSSIVVTMKHSKKIALKL